MRVGLVFSRESDLVRPLVEGVLRASGLELLPIQDAAGVDLAGIIQVFHGTPDRREFESDSLSVFRLHLVQSDTKLSSVRFADNAKVPRLLRGRALMTEAVSDSSAPLSAGEVLASDGPTAIWTSITQGPCRRDASFLSLAGGQQSRYLFHHLNGRRFVGLLPMVEWARSLVGWQGWTQPPMRACFVIDDPNLHSTSYGFVSFKDLVAEGRRHRFHTALATVPLDQYYVNRAAAGLLRDNQDVLSLLVHGNNHTRRELAGSERAELKLAMIRQALARIECLERKGGVAVARVMAPPHGACSADTISTLAEAGFEAACISHGSVAANDTSVWAASLGADATMLIRGLPVIPRIGLGRCLDSQIRISAYLGQPLVIVGHHWDLADGVGCLIETAEAIRAVQKADWCDLTTIARGNYSWKMDGAQLRVRSYSRRFRLGIPDGTSSLAVEFQSVDGPDLTVYCRVVPAGRIIRAENSGGSSYVFAPPQSCVVDVVAAPAWAVDERPVPRPRTPLYAVVRRGVVEARDRLMPWTFRRRGQL